MNKYASYKDSGIEWLGQIPSHWEIKKLKYIILNNDGGVWGDDPRNDLNDVIVLRSTEQDVDGNWKIEDPAIRNIPLKEFIQTKLNFGDLLVTKSSGSALHIGKTSYVTKSVVKLNCCYSNFMQRLTFNRLQYSKLWWYELNSDIARNQFDYLSSTTSGLANLNTDTINSLIFATPPLPEQQQIADYLDCQTAKIDELVQKQNKLIELLQEKKKSLINHVVTKGLNPDVQMKDSGIEWLGQIPAHWVVKKIKRLSLVKRGGSPRPIDDQKYFSENGEYGWVRISDVTASEKYLVETEQKLSRLGVMYSVKQKPGDIFLSIAGSVGKPIITQIKCCIHDGFVWFDELKYNKEFLYYIFLNGECFNGLGKFGTQLNLNTDTIGDIFVPFLSETETKEIILYLDSKTAKIDELINKAKSMVVLLKEHKQSLINNVVTGKIKVILTKN